MRYCLYDPVSGDICGLMESPSIEHVEIQEFPFLPAGESISDETHYVDLTQSPPAIILKQALEVISTVSELVVTLTGLPEGATVASEGLEGTPIDGRLEIEYDIPGTYHIEVASPPQYLNASLEVTVG